MAGNDFAGSKRTADEAWPDGYMTAKIQKLEQQFIAESNQFEKKSDIFKDVRIFVNGYTQPPADEIRRLVGLHGGCYLNYFRRGPLNYVICCNLSNAKKADWLKFAVRPDWIVDSIAANRRLPVADYYLEKQRTVFDVRTEKPQTASTTCDAIADLVIGRGAEEESPTKSASKSKKAEPKTASDAGFVEKFFAKSRLSFIATMKTKMQEYVRTLTDRTDHQFSGRELLEVDPEFESPGRVFMHIDMDCFFASVATRNRPDLKDRPVAVCSNVKGERRNQDPNLDLNDYGSWNWQDASTAEISCCNYAARSLGIRAGMLLGRAQAMCEDLVMLPYDFEGFEEVSKTLYDTVASLTLTIEATSVDELYAEVTEVVESCHCRPESIAEYLRKTIESETGCTCSVGLGPNILIARLATKKAKPDGYSYVPSSEIADFMSTKSVSELPGVGGSTEHKLKGLGIVTCNDLQSYSMTELKQLFGANQAVKLIELSRGVYSRDIKDASGVQRKNISVEINYGMRFKQIEEVRNCLHELSAEVSKRLQEAGMASEGIRLKILIRHPDAPEETIKYLGCGRCNQLLKLETFKTPVTEEAAIRRSVVSMYEKLDPVIKDIRGLGITLTKLSRRSEAPKNSKLLSFLGNAPKEKETQDEEVQDISDDLSTLEIYILSSEESDTDDILALRDSPKKEKFEVLPSTSGDIKKPKPTLTKQPVKRKTLPKKNENKQLDLRKVWGIGGPPKKEPKEETPSVSGKPTPSASIPKISFGPKKLFHLNLLLKEWVTSGVAKKAEVNGWVEVFKNVAVVSPRSCTVLLRTLFRLAPESWADTCETIRRRVQEYIDGLLCHGDLAVEF